MLPTGYPPFLIGPFLRHELFQATELSSRELQKFVHFLAVVPTPADWRFPEFGRPDPRLRKPHRRQRHALNARSESTVYVAEPSVAALGIAGVTVRLIDRSEQPRQVPLERIEKLVHLI